MTDDEVRRRARRAGLAVDWVDAGGEPQQVTVESLRAILAALGDGEFALSRGVSTTTLAPSALSPPARAMTSRASASPVRRIDAAPPAPVPTGRSLS